MNVHLLARPRPITAREVLDARPTAVYGAWNRDNELIYVGIADDPRRRWRQHTADKPWACEVASWRVISWLPNRPAAKAMETSLIVSQRTRWNVDESPVEAEVRQRYRDVYHCEVGDLPGEHHIERTRARHLAWPLVALMFVLKAVWWIVWHVVTAAFAVLAWVVLTLVGMIPGVPRRRRRRR